MQRIALFTMCILTLATLSACGVKPGAVEGADDHPRTYPEVRTNPAPGGGIGATAPRP